jgi:hypothetical protein
MHLSAAPARLVAAGAQPNNPARVTPLRPAAPPRSRFGQQLQHAAPRDSLLVSRAAAFGLEHEIYQRESDFHARAINIMRELTKNLKQEWHTYQAEWRANQLAKNLQAAIGAEAAAAIDEAMCPGVCLRKVIST